MHWQASDLIDRLAQEERTGLIFVDEYGHRRDYTFAEIAQHAARYAAVLRAFGVHEADRVYVCLPASAKCIFTLLALQHIGAQAILDEASANGATAVIAGRKRRAHIDERRANYAQDARYLIIGEECEGWARLDTLAQVASPKRDAPSVREIDPASLEAARTGAFERLGAVAGDVVWYAVYRDDPNWFLRAVTEPWLTGCAVVVHDRAFDAQERLDLIRELDVTILLQQADEYHAQLALPDPARFKMPRLRQVLVPEAPDEVLQTQWTQHFAVAASPSAGV